ncbi:MAG: ion transporter [Methanomicrobiales archaeon]|nr:ion transporter [Methanomicrobiales archaeon]
MEGEELSSVQRFRKNVHRIVEAARNGDGASRRFDLFMLALISANVLVVILETVKFIEANYFFYLHWFDVISVGIFTVEYILRLWSCTVEERYRNPVLGRLRFALTPLAIIDLLAILPFYLPMIIPLDLRFVRIVRLFRITRVLKFGRYSESIQTFERVFEKKWEELLMAFFVVLVILVLCSSVMYFAEHEVQPDKFGSIPDAMWWGVITLATVGYGDVYPITALGKVMGGFVALLGIAVYALPTGVLAAGFAEELQSRKRNTTQMVCPYCGHEISLNNGCHPADRKNNVNNAKR